MKARGFGSLVLGMLIGLALGLSLSIRGYNAGLAHCPVAFEITPDGDVLKQ